MFASFLGAKQSLEVWNGSGLKGFPEAVSLPPTQRTIAQHIISIHAGICPFHANTRTCCHPKKHTSTMDHNLCSTKTVEKHYVGCSHMPHVPRQVSPTWCELPCFIFLYAWQQTDHPHMLLQRATSPVTSLPDLLFPLCWAQCSFLAGCSLIVALLAYLDLVETKHCFFFHDLLRGEAVAALCGKWSRHVRHDRHVLSQKKLGEGWKSLSVCWVLTSLCS